MHTIIVSTKHITSLTNLEKIFLPPGDVIIIISKKNNFKTIFRNETLSMPSALLVARLKWLRFDQGRDGFKPEPAAGSSMYSDSTMTIY